MKVVKALKRGIQAALTKHPESFQAPSDSFQAAGKIISCSQCGSQKFVTYDLNTCLGQGMVGAHFGLACANCSHIELFAKEPQPLDTPPTKAI